MSAQDSLKIQPIVSTSGGILYSTERNWKNLWQVAVSHEGLAWVAYTKACCTAQHVCVPAWGEAHMQLCMWDPHFM